MKSTIAVQVPGGGQVCKLLSTTAQAIQYDHVGVAVAFASVAGMNELINKVLLGRMPAKSSWLFGLDNFITHPEAIKRAVALPGAKVRVVAPSLAQSIFHPKMYCFSAGGRRALVLGSANLTVGGLTNNSEAVVALTTSAAGAVAELDAAWNDAWRQGRSVTAAILEEYSNDFDVARKARAAIVENVDAGLAKNRQKIGPVLSRDDALVDPELAGACWIEVGNITGFQQDQLEIKAEQALFFGLPPHGGSSKLLKVTLADGGEVGISASYFGNQMWRLTLPQAIPEVRMGLRKRVGGKLLRSSFIAVFEKSNKRVVLTFILSDGVAYKKLRDDTIKMGTLGRTTAREYGWL